MGVWLKPFCMKDAIEMKKFSLGSVNIILSLWWKGLLVNLTPSIQMGGCRLCPRGLDSGTTWMHLNPELTPESDTPTKDGSPGCPVPVFPLWVTPRCTDRAALYILQEEEILLLPKHPGQRVGGGAHALWRGKHMSREERVWQGLLSGLLQEWLVGQQHPRPLGAC